MKFIPKRHIYRMFPYEFFKELNEAWDQWVPFQPIFTLPYTDLRKHVDSLTEVEKKEHFDEYRKTNDAFDKINLIELDITYIVPLFQYIQKDIIDKKTGTSLDPNQSDYLAVQYFDSSQQPVFAPDVKIESIRQIPEILYDDPNLLICIVTAKIDQSEPTQLAILKAPDFLTEKITEPLDKERDDPS